MNDASPDSDATTAPPSSRSWILWLPLILGAILALAYLEWAKSNILVRLDRAAFGRETAVYSAGTRDRVDQTQCSVAEDSPDCVRSWERAGKPPVILWFGNSQLMGINRAKPGDENAPALLTRLVQARGNRLITYAQPNANLSEQAIIFDAIAPVYKPKLLVLPVCYDDIRELQIRESVAAFRPNHVPDGDADETAQKPAEPGKVATNATVQARVESAATGWLGSHWSLWKERPGLRGTLGFAIHGLRNQLLGIHSTSKRPVDANLYRDRMALLDQLVARARASGTQVLLYVPPYRYDIDGPYVMPDYRRFKADLKAMAERHGAGFADIDPIVPGPEWATVTDDLFGFQEPDFMHFTAAGHKRLADAVDAQLRAMGY